MITPEQLIKAEDETMYLKRAVREARQLAGTLSSTRCTPRAVNERANALLDDLMQLLESANDKLAFVKGICGCTCPNPVLHYELARKSQMTKIDPTKCLKP